MVDDVDLFTAIHLGTGVPAGEIVCGSDSFLATTKLDVEFIGVGAHAGDAGAEPGAVPGESRKSRLAPFRSS